MPTNFLRDRNQAVAPDQAESRRRATQPKDRRILITVKSNDPAEGDKLAAALSRLPPERRALLTPYPVPGR